MSNTNRLAPSLNLPVLGSPIGGGNEYVKRASAANQAAMWNEELAGDPVLGLSSGLAVGVAPMRVNGRFPLVWVKA